MQILQDIHYVGVNDRTKHRFEGLWFLPQGVSYNSYLIVDEKVCLVDTVEADFFSEFIEQIHDILGERGIDYLVINHMEPDHSGSISLIRKYYPDVKLVGNKKTLEMVEGYYGARREDDVEVKNGDTLPLGQHELQFTLVPMLHWPETMVSYDIPTKTLFSGDAFGCFGALNGAVLDKDMDADKYFPEMERYYAAILGKYNTSVQQALKKLADIPINTICSTHGPIWTGEGVKKAIDMYNRLSIGENEQGVVICYGSMYGNTQRIAEAVAQGVAEAGVKKIIVHNLSVSQPSFVLADIFRYRGLAIGSPTYNGQLFPVVGDLIRRLSERDVKHHALALFGGYTWGNVASRLLTESNDNMKMQLVGDALEWKQSPKANDLNAARELGRALGKAVLT